MGRPLACVIGDLSLVRALGRRGVPVAVAAAAPDGTEMYSRYCRETVNLPKFEDDPNGAVTALLAWAAGEPSPPVVFYQGDHDLLALSRNRARLGTQLRCLLPPQGLVEDLVDKVRFVAFAERLALPVPPTRILRREPALEAEARAVERFPCVMKPAIRSHWFGSPLQQATAGTIQKAIRIESREVLERLLPLIARHETDLVVQAAVEGGEERIVSYHAYVRPGGELIADFTGKKVRTWPRRYGVSTCVEITDDDEVRRVGRQVLERISFSGVAKIDFKRDARDQRLYLLEINPRFNLWHHPATLAGVCLPELVYNDCVEPGSARPPGRVRAGVRWLSARNDLRVLDEYRRAGELSTRGWLFEALTADVNEDFTWRDPLPGLVTLVQMARRRLRRLTHGPMPRAPR